MNDSLKEERIMILNMVQDGKLTTDEATKLLNALRVGTLEVESGFDMEEKIYKFTKSVDSFAKDVTGKLGTAFKDAEPKLKKATKTAVEKTAKVIDDISKSLNDSLKSMEENEIKDNTSEMDVSSQETNNDDDTERHN